jgi:hypothetical protein
MQGQPLGIEHVLEQVAAQKRLRLETAEPAHIGGIGQIGLDVDTRHFAHVDMNNLDTAIPQRTKHLAFDPWLHRFSHHD